MRVLQWLAEDRVDSEAAADRPVIEAISQIGHDLIRVLPSSSDADPARPIRETAGVRRLSWHPGQIRWFEGGEVDAICEAHRGRGIDLVWIRGRAAWWAGLRSARRLDAPCWIELGSLPEATALRHPPRDVDLILTVATPAEAECLGARLRDRLLLDADGAPLIVPPAIAPPREDRATTGGGGIANGTKVVLVHPGRRPNADCIRTLAAVIESVRDRIESGSGHDGSSEAVVFLEDPLGDRKAVRRVLRRIRPEAPDGGGGEASCRHGGIVRIPPLGRCRGALGDGDVLIAPQPLLRQRPAVVEAVANGAIFASPRDPELESWFTGGPGAIELPQRERRAERAAALEDLFSVLESPARRGEFRSAMTRQLGPLLDPNHRRTAVLTALERVSGPHQAAAFTPARRIDIP